MMSLRGSASGPVDTPEWENVRVSQVGGGRDLGQEALGSYYYGQLRLQDHKSDLTLVL